MEIQVSKGLMKFSKSTFLPNNFKVPKLGINSASYLRTSLHLASIVIQKIQLKRRNSSWNPVGVLLQQPTGWTKVSQHFWADHLAYQRDMLIVVYRLMLVTRHFQQIMGI